MEIPLVTIGIPVQNSEKTIGESLDCLVHQNYPKEAIEIVVVDDGCTDNTIPIIRSKLCKSVMKTTYLKTFGSGLGIARQAILNSAHGKYIAWVDGDILLFRDFLKIEVEFMEQNPFVWQARGRWEPLEPKNLAEELENMSLVSYESNRGKSRIGTDKVVGIGGSVCRTELMKKYGFDKRITGSGEDIDIAAKLLGDSWLTRFTLAKFYHKSGVTWTILWKKYFWYGYGSHYITHKHPGLIRVWTRFAPIAFSSGFLQSFRAFRVFRKSKCFLLPFEYVFKQTAWCYGFACAYFRRYNKA